MANNYTLASFIVPMNEEQTRYALDLYQKLGEDIEESFPLAEQILENPESVGFFCAKDPKSIWISHNDSMDIENAASFVHHLVDKFDLPPIEFTWADTCSKPRINEFSGGAVSISKEHGIEIWTPYQWFRQLRNKRKTSK